MIFLHRLTPPTRSHLWDHTPQTSGLNAAICVNCVYCVNWTKFGQLIRIIIKTDDTRCQILRLKCTKIVFGWGSAPDPAGRAYYAPQDPLVAGRGSAPRAPPFPCLRHSIASVLPYHIYVRGAASVCVYCVNCTKFGQLILRIIIKIDATRCQMFRLKCTKIVFGWGCAPDPAGGELTTLPQSAGRRSAPKAPPFSCLRLSPLFAVPSLCPWRRLLAFTV